MKNVVFEGFIGDKYGREWNIVAKDIREIFSCLEANYPSARKELIDFVEGGGNFSVQIGEDFLDEETMFFNIKNDSIIITPVPAGAKSGGAKILAGVALIGFALALPWMLGSMFGTAAGSVGSFLGVMATPATATAAAGFGLVEGISIAGFLASAAMWTGAGLAVAGLAQIMAPDPSVDQNEQNYLFEGPQNTVANGVPVPVLFGEMIVGGVVISSGTVTGAQRILSTYGGPNDTGGGGGTDGGGGGGDAGEPPRTINPYNTPDTTGSYITTREQNDTRYGGRTP